MYIQREKAIPQKEKTKSIFDEKKQAVVMPGFYFFLFFLTPVFAFFLAWIFACLYPMENIRGYFDWRYWLPVVAAMGAVGLIVEKKQPFSVDSSSQKKAFGLAIFSFFVLAAIISAWIIYLKYFRAS